MDTTSVAFALVGDESSRRRGLMIASSFSTGLFLRFSFVLSLLPVTCSCEEAEEDNAVVAAVAPNASTNDFRRDCATNGTLCPHESSILLYYCWYGIAGCALVLGVVCCCRQEQRQSTRFPSLKSLRECDRKRSKRSSLSQKSRRRPSEDAGMTDSSSNHECFLFGTHS